MGEEMGCSRRKWPQSLQMGSKTGKCTCEQFKVDQKISGFILWCLEGRARR